MSEQSKLHKLLEEMGKNLDPDMESCFTSEDFSMISPTIFQMLNTGRLVVEDLNTLKDLLLIEILTTRKEKDSDRKGMVLFCNQLAFFIKGIKWQKNKSETQN